MTQTFQRATTRPRPTPLRDDEAARFLDAIIDQLPAMVFLKSAHDLRFVRFNLAGEALTGLLREDMIGKGDHDFFPPEQADFFVQKDREVLARGVIVDIPEEPIETPRGTRWLHTRKIPLYDARGEATHLLGISIDITEQRAAEALIRRSHAELEREVEARVAQLTAALDEKRRTEEALVQTQRQLLHAQKMEAIGRLAGGIAHDFNNILSVITTCSEVALSTIEAGGSPLPEIEEIRRAGARAGELTRQLLALSRRQVLEPRVVDLDAIVRNMEGMLRRVLGERVTLTVRTADTLEPVLVDPGQVEQVLMNLVVNANDAMPEGGALTIETQRVELDDAFIRAHVGARPGVHALLSVSDSGLGMDAATLSRIFEPFFTTKEMGRGTGLGLSTALGIVQQSGGLIDVSSEPGRGTRFAVYLPTARRSD